MSMPDDDDKARKAAPTGGRGAGAGAGAGAEEREELALPKPLVQVVSVSDADAQQHAALAARRPAHTPWLLRAAGAQGAALEARKAFYRQAPGGGGGGDGAERAVDADDDAVTASGSGASTAGKDAGAGAGPPARQNEELGVASELGLWSTAFNMLCYAIALGVLSIPAVVATIGVVPFVLLNLVFAGMHWYTGLLYWQLKLRYPRLQNLSDAGDLLYGRPGLVVGAVAQFLFSVLLQGNHVLLGATAFHELGWQGTCAIALAAVFALVSFAFTLPRSYRLFALFAFASFTSISIVVVFAMVAANAVGPQNAPAGAPPVRVAAFGPAAGGGGASYVAGMNAVSNLLVSYGAIPAYMPCLSEMRAPAQFHRALAVLILVELALYTVVGGVVARALGQYTTSPSLSALSPLLAKVGYGLALPVILIAGCASGQVAAKQLAVAVQRRLARRSALADAPRKSSSKRRSWTIWIAANVVTWTLAFILAELIPFFSSFLSVESSLFWSLFILFATLFHLFIIREDRAEQAQGSSPTITTDDDDGGGGEKGAQRSKYAEGVWAPLVLPRWAGGQRGAYALAAAIFAATAYLCVAGIYAAAKGIQDEFASGSVGRPFSCNIA